MLTGASINIDDLLSLRHLARELDVCQLIYAHSSSEGKNRSALRGRGLDFEEVRHYQAGDEIRAIDWRVTARTGQPHTKLFREERERPLLLAIDQSASMAFGSQVCFKSVKCCEIAALLGWAGLQDNERVGGIVFNDKDFTDIRPNNNRSAFLRLCQAIVEKNNSLTDQHKLNELLALESPTPIINQVLKEIRQLAKPGSLVCIVSDFNGLNKDGIKHLHLIKRHCDVLTIFIRDLLEYQLPDNGLLDFTDGENHLTINAANKTMKQNYKESFINQQKFIIETLWNHQINSILVETHNNAFEELIKIFPKSRKTAKNLLKHSAIA